jgi:multidrug resistance efflux pump
MKEIMIPYILIMWILVSTGALKWTLKTAFWAITGGAVILYILLLMSRFLAPADLTNSTTVKAPHAVMSRLLGEQIESIYVKHNQFVKKGDVLYTLVDINSTADLAKIDVDIIKQKEVIIQMERDLARSKISPEIFNERDIEKFTSDLIIAEAVIISLEAERQKVEWAQEKKNVTALFDGQVSTVNIAHGGTIGNMHL